MLATASSSCAVGPSCQLFSSGHGRGARQAPVPGDLSGSGLRRSSPDSEAWRENVAGQFWIAPKAIGARYSLRKIVAIRKFEPDERAHQDMHYTACGFRSTGRTRTYNPSVNSGVPPVGRFDGRLTSDTGKVYGKAVKFRDRKKARSSSPQGGQCDPQNV
jgi:hypothetical protein